MIVQSLAALQAYWYVVTAFPVIIINIEFISVPLNTGD